MKNKGSLYGQSGYLNGSLELFWGVELPSGVEHLNVAIALEAFPKVQRKKIVINEIVQIDALDLLPKSCLSDLVLSIFHIACKWHAIYQGAFNKNLGILTHDSLILPYTKVGFVIK
jgi:hypothetical protein